MRNTVDQNRIETAFANQNSPLFIPFITAGDPSLDLTVKIALALQEAGADILELGVPYSDPLADGATIQRASARALQNNVTLKDCVQLTDIMRQQGVKIPVVLFTYYNPVFQFGIGRLFSAMKQHGVDAILIPDLPVEESGVIKSLSKEFNLPLISLVAPTSKKRIQKIAGQADGFLYCVSSLGVTGARTQLSDGITNFLDEVKSYTKVPIAVGFGISTPEQMASLAPHTDALIVGSALVRVIEEVSGLLLDGQSCRDGLEKIKKFVQNMKSGVI